MATAEDSRLEVLTGSVAELSGAVRENIATRDAMRRELEQLREQLHEIQRSIHQHAVDATKVTVEIQAHLRHLSDRIGDMEVHGTRGGDDKARAAQAERVRAVEEGRRFGVMVLGWLVAVASLAWHVITWIGEHTIGRHTP
jgi:uncharacterized coiled-coil protein SlyX